MGTIPMKRVGDLLDFRAALGQPGVAPYAPAQLGHVYVKLEFKPQYENAKSAENAKGFLRSVTRATMAAHAVGQVYNAVVLEVQGSTIHIALPDKTASGGVDRLKEYAASLHLIYRAIFPDSRSRVDGWRMTGDTGKTLIVAGRGVHGDDSWVSLGRAANRPAKHLYAQLEFPEDKRGLKRFHFGWRDSVTERWTHANLDELSRGFLTFSDVADEVRKAELRIHFTDPREAQTLATARVHPLSPAGSPGSPSAENPQVNFGWVMRSDLDGFTARVDECFDNDIKLGELATQFYCIMDAAAEFARRHGESLVQLPWAGDNFTAASVFTSKEAYSEAAPRRLVELSLDFEKEMKDAAIDCGFGGWAHGVAGGEVHGNAGGNVYLAGVEIGGRRFLVGAGEGFGRSTQAFGDINPKAGRMIVYTEDWQRLDQLYKQTFEQAVTQRGEQSTLYRTSTAEALIRVRARRTSAATATTITFPSGQTRNIPTRPHYR